MPFGGIIWAIIITVVGVIIMASLGSIARNAQNRMARRPDREDQPVARPRRTTSEVERFVEEINRRRQKTGERPKAPAQRTVEMPPRLPEARPAPVPAPPPLPRVVRSTRRRDLEPAAAAVGPVPVAVPVPEVPPDSPEILAAKLSVAAVVDRKPIPPAVKQLHELLGQRNSLQTAMLLRELFEPPLSRRARKR